MKRDCLACQVATARRENARLRRAPLDALPGHCDAHGLEWEALMREVASAQLVNAARKGQAMAEDLREAQGQLYRALRVHAGRGEGEARETREAAFTRAYGVASHQASTVVMPLRDPGDRGTAGLYRVGVRRVSEGERAQELALLREAVATGRVRRVG